MARARLFHPQREFLEFFLSGIAETNQLQSLIHAFPAGNAPLYPVIFQIVAGRHKGIKAGILNNGANAVAHGV